MLLGIAIFNLIVGIILIVGGLVYVTSDFCEKNDKRDVWAAIFIADGIIYAGIGIGMCFWL